MNRSKITIRYAKALYNAGEEKGVNDTLYDDASHLYEVLPQIPEFEAFVANPQINVSKKAEILKTLFKDRIHQFMLDFFLFIVRQKREMYLIDILRSFIDYYKRQQGIRTVVFTTAHEINDALKQRIIDVIKQQYQASVDLNYHINSELIGGFVMTIDDQMYDASVANQLNRLRQELVQTKIS